MTSTVVRFTRDRKKKCSQLIPPHHTSTSQNNCISNHHVVHGDALLAVVCVVGANATTLRAEKDFLCDGNIIW